MTSASRYRIGFDVGGTFADFVLHDAVEQKIQLHKRLTTPGEPARAVMLGLQELLSQAGLKLADIGTIVHGTTLITNSIIERKGAAIGLLTTKGFRDVIEAGTEQRYDIYDLFLEFPQPLVPRNLRLDVSERVDSRGRVIEELDIPGVRQALEALVANGVESVAVCLLHSYRNPVHEQRIRALIADEFAHLHVSLSSEVVAEIKEFERCVTTCANAYVQPLVKEYLRDLQVELARQGFGGMFQLMHSAGGLLTPDAAGAFPVRLLESGPAGGSLAAVAFTREAGLESVISFDMGGTTAKACLIEKLEPKIVPLLEAARVCPFAKGSGLPIKAPTVDMIEIGAGGGSIAGLDELGLLKVGPASAGSDPGPACYGAGGADPTVTDANVLLGYYDPERFLGGDMRLDVEAAAAAMDPLAQRMGVSREEAAEGIRRLVVENMAAAVRAHLVEHGRDPRQFSIVGFGGAGPAHAADVARVLGVSEVIIPPASGAASAFGFLTAPFSFETVRSKSMPVSVGIDFPSLNSLLDEIELEARAHLEAAQILPGDITCQRFADIRIVGQLDEISVPLPSGPLDASVLPAVESAFRERYASRYAEPFPGARLEATNFRVRCVGPQPSVPVRSQARSDNYQPRRTRCAWFDDGSTEVTVVSRDALRPGDVVKGPAIVEEREATTVISPSDSLVVDASLNLRISIGAALRPPRFAGLSVPEAQRAIEADPISFEIMWSRLEAVAAEMALTVRKTALSLVISEAQDFACEIFDMSGEPLVHSPQAMPAFNLALPRTVRSLLEQFPAETLVPGDVLITNDPWLCAGHLFDIAIVTPIFLGERLVGFAASVGHVADIGGSRNTARIREIYEEGIQIPPAKLFAGGVVNAALFSTIARNVRNPQSVVGDIHALIGANEVGARRLLTFMDDYGLQNLTALALAIQGRSEQAMREAIRRLPNGVHHSEISNCPADEIVRYPLKVTISDDTIELDFTGVPPQLAEGGLNSTLNYTVSHATYPLKCALTPRVRGNAGCFRPFSVVIPEGTVLNATYPASVGNRSRTGWYIAPNVFRALAEAAPHSVQAFTGIASIPSMYGVDAAGNTYADLMFCGGGQGASYNRDGKSGLLFPSSAAATSVELLESRIPILVLEKSFVTDSGGAGRWRGGLGQRVVFRKAEDDGLPLHVAMYPEIVEQEGLFGGRPGGESFGRFIAKDGTVLFECKGGELISLDQIDTTVEFMLAGGSGYGEPSSRPRELVEQDIALGLVSADGAARDYGY